MSQLVKTLVPQRRIEARIEPWSLNIQVSVITTRPPRHCYTYSLLRWTLVVLTASPVFIYLTVRT